MDCVGCSSGAVTERPDLTAQGYRRFRRRDCDKQFNERTDGVLNRASLPSQGCSTLSAESPLEKLIDAGESCGVAILAER